MCDQTWATTLPGNSERTAGSRLPLDSRDIDEHTRSEWIRRPKWRTRTTPAQRARAALASFVLIVGTGAVLLGGVMVVLAWIGAPTWIVVTPWVVPTIAAVGWALGRPRPAVATDDDDDSWAGFAIQYVVVGEDVPRPAPARAIAALLFGAPVMWSLGVFGASVLVGLV